MIGEKDVGMRILREIEFEEAFRKGKKSGIDEGMKLGIDEGMKLGIDEGKKLVVEEIILNLLKNFDFDLEAISIIVGVNISRVIEVKEKHGL